MDNIYTKLGSQTDVQSLKSFSNDFVIRYLQAMESARKLKKEGRHDFHTCLDSILSVPDKHLNTLTKRDIIQILLDSETEEINFSRIMEAVYHGNPYHAFDLIVLRNISSIATSISKFTYCTGGEENNSFRHEQIKKVTEEFLMEICKMKSLGVFEVNILCFTLTNLVEICRNLRNLKILNIFLACDEKYESANREELKKSLRKCKEFRFSSVWCEDHKNEELQRDLTCYCVQHVPKLKEIGNYDCFTDMTNGIINYEWLMFSRLKRIDISVNSNSETISLDAFPEITHLRLANFEMILLLNWLKTKTLTNMKSLELIHPLHPAHWEQLMMYFGKNLNALNIELPASNIGDVRLAHIDAECPNLKVLKLLQIDHLSQDATWSLRKFKQLVELQIQVKISCTKPSDFRRLIADILSVPTLEKVTLENIPVIGNLVGIAAKITTYSALSLKIVEFNVSLRELNRGAEKREEISNEDKCQEIQDALKLALRNNGASFRVSLV